jgi:hypothetical protein
MSIRFKAFSGAVLALALLGLQPVGAQQQQEDPRKRTDIDKALGEQLYQEQQARRGCKVALCEAARTKAAQGDNIACKVLKTWPDVDLKSKVLKGAMEWPFGHASCEASITIDRKMLAAAMSEATYEAKIGKHDVTCQLSTKDGKDKHALTFSIDPVVTFEKGKATKAALHWSNVGGTTIAKSAAWSATAVDNTFNVLQGAVIEQINGFFVGCDEAGK